MKSPHDFNNPINLFDFLRLFVFASAIAIAVRHVRLGVDEKTSDDFTRAASLRDTCAVT
jgi:hypothetical protein